DDLAYYWFHRISHENRVFWASHVVHHSSRHYNLSTALRQTWVPMTYLPFWLPLLLVGFPPWMVLLAQSWSLIYQFGLHTERIGFHEYVALWHDVRAATTWRRRAGHLWHGPGWTPEEETAG